MGRQGFRVLGAFLAGLVITAWATPAAAQWQIDTKDGQASIKFGFLAQPQLETLTTADGNNTSTNLFLRRFRILFGGKVSDKWQFFFETDSPNLGKGDTAASAAKNAGNVYIQDAFVTYNHSDVFKVDAGMLLLPLSHNHEQSAATLLPVDYGAYTFVESGPLDERVGRDYGIEVRGYPMKQKLEYRLGVYQGLRGTESRNGLRWVGRGVFYAVGNETGYFYGGTFQGQKALLGIGASFDVQKEYNLFGVDATWERPINKGEQGVTFQIDWNRIDGGTFITTLPKQDTLLVEGGFHLAKGRFTPFVQYASRNYSDAAQADQYTFNGGAAYWMKGHNRNIKGSIGKVHTDGKPDRTQGLLQLQIFFY